MPTPTDRRFRGERFQMLEPKGPNTRTADGPKRPSAPTDADRLSAIQIVLADLPPSERRAILQKLLAELDPPPVG